MTLVSTLTCLIVLWMTSPERQSVGWFSAFLLAIHAGNITMIIGFAGAFDTWPGLTFLPVDLAPLLGPLLWLHARSLMLEPCEGHTRWWLVPGLMYWLYQVWAFTALGDHLNKWAFNDAWHEPYVLPVVFSISLGLGIWALWSCWRLHRHYATWLATQHGDNLEFRPVWLIHVIFLAGAYGVLSTVEYVLDAAYDYGYYDRYWVDFAAMCLMFFISVEALVHMQRRYPKMPLGAMDALTESASVSSDAEDREWVNEGRSLREAMLDQRWYLEPGITLEQVAHRMGTNQTYVSRALNKGLSLNFSQLVNGLRVAYAQERISEAQTSFIDIALESGFGSKASFNRAFRQHAGMTPSQWRSKR